jgi:hypothetical protein
LIGKAKAHEGKIDEAGQLAADTIVPSATRAAMLSNN